MYIRIFMLMTFSMIGIVFAGEPKQVSSVEAINGVATMHAFNKSCSSYTMGSIGNISTVSKGDTVTLAKQTITIGFIEAEIVANDAYDNGELLYAKGDTVCLLAATGLPQPHQCNGLWVRIPQCKVLK